MLVASHFIAKSYVKYKKLTGRYKNYDFCQIKVLDTNDQQQYCYYKSFPGTLRA